MARGVDRKRLKVLKFLNPVAEGCTSELIGQDALMKFDCVLFRFSRP